MRDVLMTLASAGPDPGLLHVRAGGWESFVDLRGGVVIQFGHVEGRLIARILAVRRAPGPGEALAADMPHATLLALRDLLRRAAHP